MPARFVERGSGRFAQAGGRARIYDTAVIVFLIVVNLAAIAPFLAMDFSSQPWNNDYTYIGMTRMFRDRPWSWNSLQYGGAPFHYLYPPLFHLMVMALPVGSLGRAYHLASAAGYALVAPAFYIAALQLFRSRRLAAALALIESFSPNVLYYLLPGFGVFARNYRHGPWNFVTLIASNESAHTLSLAMILLVLAAAWRDRWVVASLLAAAIFLTNWAGIIGLLMVLAAVAVARSRELGFFQAGLRAAAVAGTGYGLAAFWASPDCIYTTKLLDRVVLRNIQPSAPWNGITVLILAGAAVLLGISLWRRVPATGAFVLALLAMTGAVVVAYNAAGNYLLPLPHRYVQEFNAGMVLGIGCLTAVAWRWRRSAGMLILILSALPAAPFLAGAWTVQERGIDPRTTSAFQISDWLARHAGSSRVLVAGELEGALNIWTDVPQVAGSAQGVSNYLMPAAQREVAMGCGLPQAPAHIAELWLRAMDVRYLVVHAANSTEHFHWFVQPDRYAGWPVAWTNGADTIYQVPAPDEQAAVVVDLGEMRRLPALGSTGDPRFLEAYVQWARGKRPAQVRWWSPDRAELRAAAGPGEAILLKVNYDSGWSLSRGTTAPDPIGFLLLKGTPGGAVNLHYGASWPQWLGRAITAAVLLMLIRGVPLWIIAAAALIPAISAYGVLAIGTPARVTVAERTYRQLRPPLISPGGIVDGITYAPPPVERGRVVSIFGSGFGSGTDVTRVWLNQRPAEVLYHGAGLMNVRIPGDAPPRLDISVEVNGCRGNGFAVPVK